MPSTTLCKTKENNPFIFSPKGQIANADCLPTFFFISPVQQWVILPIVFISQWALQLVNIYNEVSKIDTL